METNLELVEAYDYLLKYVHYLATALHSSRRAQIHCDWCACSSLGRACS
jgi:hypothetical protein